VEADYLVTCNPYDKIIKNAAIYVLDGIITALGTKKEIHKDYSSSKIINGENKILMPGLVNTHCHSVQTLLRGKADDLALLDWLKEVILPGEANFTAHEVYVSSLLGFAEMIRTGTTTANDMLTTHDSEKGIEAAIECGIRTRIGKMLMDSNQGYPASMIKSADEVMEEAIKQIDHYHGIDNKRIKYSLNARFLLSCTPKLMKMIVETHKEYEDLMIHTHASESKAECKEVERIYKKSYIRALKGIGALGDKTIVAHGIWLDDEEYKIIKETNVDLIHSDYSRDLWTIVPALYFSKQVPIVLIKHIGTQKPKRDFLHAWIYQHVKHIIAISTVIRNNVVETHPIDSDRVSVIHNGVSLERFDPHRANRAGIRKEFSISHDEIVIGIIGRLQVAKGYLEFLKMASMIAQSYKNVRFMIVGEATRGHETEAQMILAKIEELGLQQRIIYTGYREDVPSLLAAMDLFVFPSRAEAFGLVLIEAMAMQLPVIACRSDGVLDIVVENETGFLFTPKDVKELYQAVLDLLEHPEKRVVFGQAGHRRVIEKFSDTLMLDNVEILYHTLISQYRASSLS